MGILPYTFRAFPETLLKDQSVPFFKFGKLHEDLKKFEAMIAKNKPELIIGFALSRSSRQETVAVNRFNSGVIDKNGQDMVQLRKIADTPFDLTAKPTHTFCNWTMYKLAQKYPVAFFHIKKTDTELFFDWLQTFTVSENS